METKNPIFVQNAVLKALLASPEFGDCRIDLKSYMRYRIDKDEHNISLEIEFPEPPEEKDNEPGGVGN